MATLVKGDKIKDGSIPLSALSTEVKNKIENAGGRADWNARPGEAGYIENKPIQDVYKINILEIGEKEQEISTPVWSEYINIVLDFVHGELRIPFIINTDVYDLDNTYINFSQKTNNNTLFVRLKYVAGPKLLISAYDGNIDGWYAENVTITITNDHSSLLSSSMIDNSVIKTTPQTLSNTDKNQALANLGIDPVVWKYMCNPCIAELGNSVPEDLLKTEDESEIFKYLNIPSIFKIKYEGNIYNVISIYPQSLHFIKDDELLYMTMNGFEFSTISDIP